ncbi:hypothetical protein MTO96_034289, partial [Rhipicephalus appendiculatus]
MATNGTLPNLRHLLLSDAWVYLHNDLFKPTRTASRIDRIYLPDFLLTSLEECEVVEPPDGLKSKTDHSPVVATIRGSPNRFRDPKSWRIDACLLGDEVSTGRIMERLQASLARFGPINPEGWDRLKDEWRTILQEEGKARQRWLTDQRNELLRRMRIIKAADSLTSCMRDYLESLETLYNRLLQERSRSSVKTHNSPTETTEVELHEIRGNGSNKISEAKRPDGTTTDDPSEIRAIFRDHFMALFQESDPSAAGPAPRQIGDLCRGLRRLDEEEYSTLGGEASLDELRCAIRNMPPNSAPGTHGLTAGVFYSTFFETLGGPLLAL